MINESPVYARLTEVFREAHASETGTGMRQRVYVETSVVSYFTARPSRDLIIAGHQEAVERAAAALKGRGAKLVKALPVSAPFHCALMAPAASRLAAALRDVTVGTLRVPVVSNVEAAPNSDAGRVKELLTRQVTAPVRWEESVRALVGMGVKQAVEIGPGTVLTGLCKRIAPEIKAAAACDPAQVRALAALAA